MGVTKAAFEQIKEPTALRMAYKKAKQTIMDNKMRLSELEKTYADYIKQL